jgi:predicted 3-demethylubiquinone-9 3-methyltransferase (glyoxalase superfamily)
MAKNTICVWYDKDAEAAARFYAATFPDSAVSAVHRAPGDYPSGKEGDVLTVEFTVAGVACLGLNGGPIFTHNEAFSFQIATDDQEETDRYWNAIVGNGGQESACGWCRGQACVRGDDGNDEDRCRRDRGGAPRVKRILLRCRGRAA